MKSNPTICTYFSYRDGVIKCDLQEKYFGKRKYKIETVVGGFKQLIAEHNICNFLGYLIAKIEDDPKLIFSVCNP